MTDGMGSSDNRCNTWPERKDAGWRIKNLRNRSTAERKTMKQKMTTELAKLAVEALKVPHIAVLVGMLGMGVIFAYVK